MRNYSGILRGLSFSKVGTLKLSAFKFSKRILELSGSANPNYYGQLFYCNFILLNLEPHVTQLLKNIINTW
jgi:hypothetical protein